MGAFCCHGNQTKSQITIILTIFKSPYQSNIVPNKGQITSMALEELSFESVNGCRDAQKVITVAHPEHSSDELKSRNGSDLKYKKAATVAIFENLF